MMRGFTLTLLGAAALVATAQPPHDEPAPHRIVNLDLPPRQRWQAIAREFREPMQHTLSWVANKSRIFGPVVDDLKAALKTGGGWPLDWVDEMHGLADAGGVSYSVVETANLFFEWDPGCTAIVAQLDDGTIINGRNFDFSVKGLPEITLELSFTRGGEVVYKGNSFAGYVGVITAMRPRAFSVSANSRFQGDHGGKVNLLENIKVAKQGGMPIGAFIRSLVDTPNTFAGAVAVLQKQLLIDVAYYTLAGVRPGEGAVVTRGRFGPDNSHGAGNGTWMLDAPSSWWRLQTNFDHWGPAFDSRRGDANAAMARIGRGRMSLAAMNDGVLSVKPVLAPDTDFTALMEPKTGRYTTTLRSHPKRGRTKH